MRKALRWQLFYLPPGLWAVMFFVFFLFGCTTNTPIQENPAVRQEQGEITASRESGDSIEQIDQVIQSLAANIERRLPENTRLAVVNVSSESAVFSDYVIEELIIALEESGRLMIVDRNALHLAMVRSELDFQYSGDVSDETQQSLGRMLGAQSILSASLLDLGDAYRLRAAVIRVETLAREATVASDVQKSERVDFLMRTNEPVTRRRIENPVTAADFRRRGNEYLHDWQDYDRAIADFTQAIMLNPRDADAYVLRADAYYERKDYYRAIEDLTEVIRLVPAYTLAYRNRGWMYIEVRDYERAEEDLIHLLGLDPNNALAFNHLGVVRSGLGDYHGALEAYNQSIRLSNNAPHWFMFENRARVHFRLGDTFRAQQDLERAFRLNPDGGLIRLRLEALSNNIWIE